MLDSTSDERQEIVDYMALQAPNEQVSFLQKVYSENLHGIIHDVWDVHSDTARWWVITGPTNLYLQSQFPNMDLALTFHVGLCLRMPRSEREAHSSDSLEPFVKCWVSFGQIASAIAAARDVDDYQAIGVRCRESLLSVMHVIQDAVEFPEDARALKRSDFLGWANAAADVLLAGASQKARRQLLKSSAKASWDFVNWLTHARESHFNDAEAAVAATNQVMSLITSVCIRHVRGVPDCCPVCGSHHLAPQRGTNTEEPGRVYERPACTDCDWIGDATEIMTAAEARRERSTLGECAVMATPLVGKAAPQPNRKGD